VVVLYLQLNFHRQRELEIWKVKPTIKGVGESGKAISTTWLSVAVPTGVSGLQYMWQVITDLELVSLP